SRVRVEGVDEDEPGPRLLGLEVMVRGIAAGRPGRVAPPHDDELRGQQVQPIVGIEAVVAVSDPDDRSRLPPGAPGKGAPVPDVSARQAQGPGNLASAAQEDGPVAVLLPDTLDLAGHDVEGLIP